jgi:hypothetical protein
MQEHGEVTQKMNNEHIKYLYIKGSAFLLFSHRLKYRKAFYGIKNHEKYNKIF